MSTQWERVLAAFGAGPPDPPDVTNKVLLFETLWADPADGWAIASRAAARAMHAGNIDVRLVSWAAAIEDHSAEIIEEVRPFLRRPRGCGFYVFSCTFASPERMSHQRVLETIPSQGPRYAFYTTFERLRVSPRFKDPLNALHGVWVPCTQNKQALEAIGVTNVHYIPFPYFDDDPHLAVAAAKRDRVQYQASKFYWIGRWEPRKAPENLVKAFLRAFEPYEARLTMKTSPITWHGSWPSFDVVLENELRDPAVIRNGWTHATALHDIRVITGRLPKEELVQLHEDNDVYVSASRGEGTDLPAFAAKLAGNRLLTTDSGGPRDFLGERDILVPRTSEVPADPTYEWEPDATYAGYELDALIAGFQKARREPPTNRHDLDIERFHYQAVGQDFRQFVEACSQRAGKPWVW